MSEFSQAYQSPSVDTLSIQLPHDMPSNDFTSNEETIHPMYQRGYEEGEKDGYGRGSENGYYQGYRDGKRDGKRDGYEEGYNEGIYRGLWFGTAWTVVASIMMFGMKSGRR